MLKLVDKFNTPYMAVETKQAPDISKSRPIYSRIDNEYTTFYISPDGLHNVFCYHGKWFLMPPFSQGMELIRYLASPRRMGNFYTGAPARRSSVSRRGSGFPYIVNAWKSPYSCWGIIHFQFEGEPTSYRIKLDFP